MSTAVAPPPAPARSRRVWAWVVGAVAVAAVVIAGVVGIRGLLANPVKGTDAQGVTTLDGDYEPFTRQGAPQGYIQAGGRSVFVIFPATCAQPSPGAHLVVHARLNRQQGTATYQALGCPAG